MKYWFIVENVSSIYSDDCILVYNYFIKSKVVNLPLHLNQLESFKDHDSIGVWKIKSLKN